MSPNPEVFAGMSEEKCAHGKSKMELCEQCTAGFVPDSAVLGPGKESGAHEITDEELPTDEELKEWGVKRSE